MESITERRCIECGKTKPIDDFKNGGMFLSTTCKDCTWIESILDPLRTLFHLTAPRELNRVKMIRLPKIITPQIKEEITQAGRNYRASLHNADGKIMASEWRRLCKKFGNKCLCCGRSDVKLTLDHIVPLSHGGSNTIDNAQPLCNSCNSRKGTRTIDFR